MRDNNFSYMGAVLLEVFKMSSRRILDALSVVCLMAALIGGVANAKTIYVDDNATGANDGSSWKDAYKYLQDAMTEARSIKKPVEIWVAMGTYRPDLGANQTRKDQQAVFQLIDGVTLKGGFAGSGEPDPGARNVDSYETILSGDLSGDDVAISDPLQLSGETTRAENSHFVVASIKTHETAVIDGFTITGGNGHGMYNRRGSPTLIHCTFNGNQASRWGGGMCNEGGSAKLSNCTFKANRAQYGGGMWCLGGSPVLTCCTFTENSAIYGGGMYNYNNSSPQVVNCAFVNNSATYGAAMYSNNNCRASIINCTLAYNVAYVDGGAVRNIDNCSPRLTNCILWSNMPDDIVDHFMSSSIVNYSYVQYGSDQSWFGEGCIDTDPLFVAPDDLRLSPSSPCIDAGDNTALPSEVTTSLDGNPRFINGKVDMGAFEAGSM